MTEQPLRTWPGVAIALLLLLVRFVMPSVAPDTSMLGVIGGMVGAMAIIVWWVFFSRAPWLERLGAVVLMVAALMATRQVVHASISNGMMGMMVPILGLPVLTLALVAAAAATRRLSTTGRRASIATAILLASSAFTLLRTGGINGAGDSDLHWRWTKSPEELLLAKGSEEPVPAVVVPPSSTSATRNDAGETRNETAEPPAKIPPPAAAAVAPASVNKGGAEWPGFRGPQRDGIVRGVRIATDWTKSPPVQLWRRPIGPGWSSFAVRGDLFYTQEQRGDAEIVSCHKVSTGELVWRHRDPVRFWESNGGAGPRATPTLSGDRIYTFGATGVVNALDAATGAIVWTRNASSDTGRPVPDWGFASSPLVVGDVVIVAASGSLVGYDRATGEPKWFGPPHGGSYSSPHLSTLDGVPQILLLNGAGATSVAPANGAVLWEYEWPGNPIVQPALMPDGDVIINTASVGGVGTRRLHVRQASTGWSISERWTSNGLKPYFNDFVVHKGHAFGFDGKILACIDLEDGSRKWKGGRYGNGQLVLLADQDLLLVLSEDGELALVEANTNQFTELARFRALEGKTWNHPVLVGNTLLVRNGEEMSAYRLTLEDR